MPVYDPKSGQDPERYDKDYNYLRDEYRLYGRYAANAGLAPCCRPLGR
jgi:hypothetical protein